MSKYKNGKSISIRYYGNKLLVAAYKGLRLIWSSVRSCFGSGGWRDDRPWIDGESWKD